MMIKLIQKVKAQNLIKFNQRNKIKVYVLLKSNNQKESQRFIFKQQHKKRLNSSNKIGGSIK